MEQISEKERCKYRRHWGEELTYVSLGWGIRESKWWKCGESFTGSWPPFQKGKDVTTASVWRVWLMIKIIFVVSPTDKILWLFLVMLSNLWVETENNELSALFLRMAISQLRTIFFFTRKEIFFFLLNLCSLSYTKSSEFLLEKYKPW